MSKRQVQDEEMPRGAVLFLGVGGGVLLSIVWCALGEHFDRLDEMENDIYRAQQQIVKLQELGVNRVVTYSCDELKDVLENFSKSDWSEWHFYNVTVKGKCK